MQHKANRTYLEVEVAPMGLMQKKRAYNKEIIMKWTDSKCEKNHVPDHRSVLENIQLAQNQKNKMSNLNIISDSHRH